MAGLKGIRQRGHPVVGNLYLLPRDIVELGGIGTFVVDGTGLCEVVEILGATAEILCRVGSMAKGKLPPLVQTDGFTHVFRMYRYRQDTAQCHQKKCF